KNTSFGFLRDRLGFGRLIEDDGESRRRETEMKSELLKADSLAITRPARLFLIPPIFVFGHRVRYWHTRAIEFKDWEAAFFNWSYQSNNSFEGRSAEILA